ncbi:MAG: NAD-dependent epimerase/dehydratase family protein [Candidatus Adiutrix sp.]
MKTLITGSAGFIGAALAQCLLAQGDVVIGLDNHNSYYSPALKEARVAQFINHPNYTHLRLDLCDQKAIENAFATHRPQRVVNLAAQAGVRYSLENPLVYIQSNVVGFAHILEACRHHGVEYLVYASSSSVYGANTVLPFSVKQNADSPQSLYAATKKSNELMAHTYSHLYNLPTVGLRFFTVYGPWGRPDMALFKFTKAILEGAPIKIFNHGKHQRDFTYIDDIVNGIVAVLKRPPHLSARLGGPKAMAPHPPYALYNIGASQPVELMDFIEVLEKTLGKQAKKVFLPLQAGDILDTYADVSDLMAKFAYKPNTTIETGITNFVNWYKQYYNIDF